MSTTTMLRPIPTLATRAISSTLSSHSAPSIPPASQTYEPLVKATLRRRLTNRVFLYTAICAWSLTYLSILWLQGGVDTLGFANAVLTIAFPATWAFAIIIWLAAVVPVIVMRKVYLTAYPTAATSPLKVFHAAFSKQTTLRAALTYASSAIFLAGIHALMAHTYESTSRGDPHLTVFVKSKKHPYYLNGRLIYLISSQLNVAFAYLLRNILLDRFVVRWLRTANPKHSDLDHNPVSRVTFALAAVALFTFISTISHIAMFAFARSIVLPILFRLPILPHLLKPFVAHFLKGPWTFTLPVRHFALILRTAGLGATTVTIWEVAESIFDSATSEAITVAHNTADPALTLVSGIASQDLYYKHFAYQELRQLAGEQSQESSARRAALFADQKYNPSIWSSLVREALLTLGKDYQLFLRRGKPEVPAPAAPPEKPKAAVVSPPAPATPLVRKAVFKSSPQSPLHSALDAVAADGTLSAAIASTTEAGASHIPELFRSVLHVETTKAIATVRKGEQKVAGLAARVTSRWREMKLVLYRCTPVEAHQVMDQLGEWWSRERLHKTAEACLPNRYMDALAVEVLCDLVCASLKEDSYGVVQRDIPKILEALLSFLTAIEEYQTEINASEGSTTNSEGLSPGELAKQERATEEAALAGAVLSEVGDALKDGVARVAQTFGEKLSAFKFPPRTAKKLQDFVDYNQR